MVSEWNANNNSRHSKLFYRYLPYLYTIEYNTSEGENRRCISVDLFLLFDVADFDPISNFGPFIYFAGCKQGGYSALRKGIPITIQEVVN